MILLALLGCPAQRPFCVSATNATASAMTVELGEGRDCNNTPVVRQINVRAEEKMVWSVFSTEGIPLRTLRYGQVPEGFEAARAAIPLSPGQTVVIEVQGIADRGGLKLTVENP